MIKQASELLEKFIEIEKEKLESFNMSHMPTLGSAYEELTKQAIDQNFIIPENLNLRVVSGFISIDSIIQPSQIDGMLVKGEGEKYGLTNNYIYPIDQVLCIFEIKKTLKKNDYIDAFDHLKKIRAEYDRYFIKKFVDSSVEPNIEMASIHFSEITGKAAPRLYSERNVLCAEDQLLFSILVQETNAPASIIYGYGGYKTEGGMRNAFVDIIEEKDHSYKEIGIPYIPTLVTTNGFSIIKGNGIPYVMTVDDGKDSRRWVPLFSSKYNTAATLLEIIWSKISLYNNYDMDFGDDLVQENTLPLVVAAPKVKENFIGWEYEVIQYSEKLLKERSSSSQWVPKEVNKIIDEVFLELQCSNLMLSIDVIADIAKQFDMTYQTVLYEIKSCQFFKEVSGVYTLIRPNLALLQSGNKLYLTYDINRLISWCRSNQVDGYCTILSVNYGVQMIPVLKGEFGIMPLIS